MYKCTCNINVDPIKFPNHLKSKRHKYLYQKHHPFFIFKQKTNSKETTNIIVNELIK
jgi:hypothetical protein